MSTKIYHGCRAPRTMDLFELVDAIRAVIIPERLRLEATSISRIATVLYDREARTGERGAEGTTLMPFFDACTEWESVQDKLTPTSPMYDPYRFELQIIPSGDYYYLIPYLRQDTYLDALTSVDGVEHFPYWDNTDGPDHLTAEEWDAVGEEWMAVPGVRYGQIAAGVGVLVTLGVDRMPLVNLMQRLDLLVDNQPSIKKRQESVLNGVVQELVSQSGDQLALVAGRDVLGAHPDVVSGMVPLTEDDFIGQSLPNPLTVDVDAVRKFLVDNQN